MLAEEASLHVVHCGHIVCRCCVSEGGFVAVCLVGHREEEGHAGLMSGILFDSFPCGRSLLYRECFFFLGSSSFCCGDRHPEVADVIGREHRVTVVGSGLC